MQKTIARFTEFIHRNLLWCLITAYAMAAIFPSGANLRSINFGSISLPQWMLAWLLFNAGAGITLKQAKEWRSKFTLTFAALVANSAIPLIYLFVLSMASAFWPERDEIQIILVGLVISAAMPVAGSSTAWSQNAGGNSLVSLAMVIASTILSPLITPVTLHLARLFVGEDVAAPLSRIDFGESALFLAQTVLVPSLAGIGARAVAGEKIWAKVHPCLRCTNLLNLLILNYSNAASALPRALAEPDWDFLVLVSILVSLQCSAAFYLGWWLSSRAGAEAGDRTAVMYGLGMTNNGTGLVLVNLHLSDFPLVALPLILANLVQQIGAGWVGHLIERKQS